MFTESDKPAESDFRFPTGSIIVREKLVGKNKPTVKSLAVMIKRQSSFSPEIRWLAVPLLEPQDSGCYPERSSNLSHLPWA